MTRLTIDDLITELDNALQLASECQKPSAMIAATMSKAKLLGLDKADSTHDATPQPVVFNITGISPDDASKAYKEIMQ